MTGKKQGGRGTAGGSDSGASSATPRSERGAKAPGTPSRRFTTLADVNPASVGRVLKPLRSDDDLLGEMIGERREWSSRQAG